MSFDILLIVFFFFRSRSLCCCCSLAKSCLTVCHPMDCSMPGSPVLHYLLDFAPIHIHWVTVCVKVAQSYLTHCDTMDYIVHGILQARILEWVALPSPGNFFNPGIEPRSPALQMNSLPAEPPGKPIESLMLSNRLILCCPFLLLSSIFPGIRVFFSESALLIRWCQSIRASVSASVLPMNIQGWYPLGLTGLISLLSKGLSRVFSSITVWKHQFFGP